MISMFFCISSPRQAQVPLRQLSPQLSRSTQPQQPNLTRHVCNPLTLTNYQRLAHRGDHAVPSLQLCEVIITR